jgi:lipopolysaccharide heptosyltransferase II
MILCDFEGRERSWRGFAALARQLFRQRFDRVIDLQNNKKSHLLAYATMSPYRYGYDNGKYSFLLNHRVDGVSEPIGPVAHQFRVLERAGIIAEDPSLELWPSQADDDFVLSLLREGSDQVPLIHWVGINIGASARWETKRWPAKRFSRLCDQLAQEGFGVVLTGMAGDGPWARRILKGCSSVPVCSVGRTNLMQLAALIGRCRVFVTGDSAPLHVAAAMKTPVVALFGPTDARRHMPPCRDAVVLAKGPHAPCYKPVCRTKEHRCMKAIEVGNILNAVRELAQRTQVRVEA